MTTMANIRKICSWIIFNLGFCFFSVCLMIHLASFNKKNFSVFFSSRLACSFKNLFFFAILLNCFFQKNRKNKKFMKMTMMRLNNNEKERLLEKNWGRKKQTQEIHKKNQIHKEKLIHKRERESEKRGEEKINGKKTYKFRIFSRRSLLLLFF